MNTEPSRFEVRLAQNEQEIASAQRLRYRVFVDEMGAQAGPAAREGQLEFDNFDPYFDHLILLDRENQSDDPLDKVVGVYRLMRGEVAEKGIGFYGATEYDLQKLIGSGRKILELGRSCVGESYRGGMAMLMLWNALAEYVAQHEIEILFGVASFPGIEPDKIADALANLHHFHQAPEDIRVTALPHQYLDMALVSKESISIDKALQSTPPLIKAYLRHGGFVGDGAVIDHDFNTIDVCLLMDTKRMKDRYRKFYMLGLD